MDLDTGVVQARWSHDPVALAIGEIRGEVGGFGRRHGMDDASRDDFELAVSEVTADAVTQALAHVQPGGIVVEAATDGEWMSVRITSDGDDCARPLPLVELLAHRTEFGRTRGERNAVLMEFPMARDDAARTDSGHHVSADARAEPGVPHLRLASS